MINFISFDDLSEVEIFVVPELRPFLAIATTTLFDIARGEENSLTLILRVSHDIPPGTSIDGVLHIRNGKKNLARPLPIVINVLEPKLIELLLIQCIF